MNRYPETFESFCVSAGVKDPNSLSGLEKDVINAMCELINIAYNDGVEAGKKAVAV